MAKFLRREVYRNITKRVCHMDIELVRRTEHPFFNPAQPAAWQGDTHTFLSVFIERGPNVDDADVPSAKEMSTLYCQQALLSNWWLLRAMQLGLKMKDVTEADFAAGGHVGPISVVKRVDAPLASKVVLSPYEGREMLLSVDAHMAKEHNPDLEDFVIGYRLSLDTKGDKAFGPMHYYLMRKLLISAAYRLTLNHGVPGSALSLYEANKWNLYHSVETHRYR
eukprot:TRINITY_DN32163_c0_g1_i1.p1 TRINITY_DN32163_c0_g1~~TRINITY_DN32163_c0_g1_i1.p1  ORF type:complete len:249 (+),score=77.83 TRINITY_DN32163_c0_g1_i1:83-748(+)